MYKVDDEIIRQMAQAIVRAADPELIMLFGSRALGRPGSESDIDLPVVEKEAFGPGRSRLQELTRLRAALSPFRVPKDILLYSVAEVEKWKGSLNHILTDIFQEGKKLYERP